MRAVIPGRPPDLVTINASDDFRVTEVKVFIYSSDGTEIERGNAVNAHLKPLIWKYKTTLKNPKVGGSMIKAIAFDMADNRCEAFLNFD